MNFGRAICRIAIVVLTACGALAAQPVGQDGNLPLPPQELVRRFRVDPFEIAEASEAGGGVTGAQKVRLVFRDGVRLDAKWKTGPDDGDDWNNSPRREIAAYVAQQLFLDPDDYVVPPTALRCMELETFRPVDSDPEPTLDGTRCVFGMLSAWLTNVFVPRYALDARRFSAEYRYAYHFANLNLFTYLIDHRDARYGNFLMSKARYNPQIFAIDNGIAFGGTMYNFFTWHYDELRVRGLPKESIARLRGMTRADWQRLAVVEQLQVDGAGILRPVPLTAPLDPTRGARWRDGTLQLGLTADEIERVARRASRLLAKIDQGRIALF